MGAQPGRFLNLHGAYVRRANLDGTSLRHATLAGADASNASFMGADFESANLAGTILKGADLSDARNLTAAQIRSAVIDGETVLPGYINRSEVSAVGHESFAK